MSKYCAIELCAGAGGQALGLEMAGFSHSALVEIDADCCRTLRHNRPEWTVLEQDVRTFDGTDFKAVDLLAGGLPCPPFSVAGKQLGHKDERNLFDDALRLVREIEPKAVLIENVRGFLSESFADYRNHLSNQFQSLGYSLDIFRVNASDFGVSQLRPRVVIVAFKNEIWPFFKPPVPSTAQPPSVGELLGDLMAAEGWKHSKKWVAGANSIAPTIVGGSKKHGGPDLGPTRAREAWRKLGVNGSSIAPSAPERDFEGDPRLTVRMVARVQGFPDSWHFTGKKTAAYRQVGNAFPAPVAAAFGQAIIQAFDEFAGVIETPCDAIVQAAE